MAREYRVKRKLQEQSGSYFVVLPKLWVESLGLEQGDQMSIVFNGIVKVLPPSNKTKKEDRQIGFYN
jgi:antitoxin component of MazEF toxin-antitoxin module